MTVKNAKENVNAAEDEVIAAQKKLDRAQIELAKAQVAPAALETPLKETSHLVWKICQLKDWDDESKALYEKAQAFEDELALLLLGAGPRLAALHELDPDRWSLEGEFKMRAGDYPTDKDVSYAIATAIFDAGFGRGSNTAYQELSDEDKDRWRDYKTRAEDICGPAGTQGFEFWRQGRHDT